MKIKLFFSIFILSFLLFSCDNNDDKLVINLDSYKSQEINVEGKLIKFRAFENIVYVKYPVDSSFQKMNIYIPEEYFNNQTIDGFNSESAPIFFPNQIGGYMPSKPGKAIINSKPDSITTIAYALSKGYVVASAGARGRTQPQGRGTAMLLDQKSAIRFLKFNDKVIPGNANKIIANGTSAGGAIATLLGATGNSTDFQEDLDVLGAARTSDNIFAVSAYCPITNLDHADAAYEWQFHDINAFDKLNITVVNGVVNRNIIKGNLTAYQKSISYQLKQLFPPYLNALRLKNKNGSFYKLDKNGEGDFKDYIKILLVISAETAKKEGIDMSKYDFLVYSEGKIIDIDFHKYLKYLKREKTPPAFDALDLSAPENELFGNNAVERKHFTPFSFYKTEIPSVLADPATIKQLNPMNYIGKTGANNANFWRIRHGTKDKETSLAISAILALSLEKYGHNVNYYLPWDKPHGGDYDLPELFDWIKAISNEN